MVIILNKQKKISILKVQMLLIKAQLQNLLHLSPLTYSRSNKFNSPNNRALRPKFKTFPMASKIKGIELLRHYLKEYLGILL